MQKKNFLSGRVVPDFPVDGHKYSSVGIIHYHYKMEPQWYFQKSLSVLSLLFIFIFTTSHLYFY